MSILFIGKRDDFYCDRAAEFISHNYPEATFILGRRTVGQPLPAIPDEARGWRGEYIISYLSPWVIPGDILSLAKVAAINFHPGPPEYPGIGCTNFAIYNNEKTFGVTCHHMAAKVDTGEIIDVRRFALLESDSVYSLTQRCYAHILTLFYDVMTGIIQGRPLPRSSETWQRQPYRRSEFEELRRIAPGMAADEVRRRIRATSFPGAPGAYMDWPRADF